MVRFRGIAYYSLAVLIALHAFPPVIRAKNLAVRDKLRRHFEEVCKDRKFMGTVLITANGKEVFSGACGWANVQWNIKNAIDTRFLIGSITKEFTAAAV